MHKENLTNIDPHGEIVYISHKQHIITFAKYMSTQKDHRLSS